MLLHRLSGQNNIPVSFPIAIKEGKDFIYGAQLNSNIINHCFEKKSTVIDAIKQSAGFFNELRQKDIDHSHYPITNIAKKNNKYLLDVCFAQTSLRETGYNFEGITKTETSLRNWFRME